LCRPFSNILLPRSFRRHQDDFDDELIEQPVAHRASFGQSPSFSNNRNEQQHEADHHDDDDNDIVAVKDDRKHERQATGHRAARPAAERAVPKPLLKASISSYFAYSPLFFSCTCFVLRYCNGLVSRACGFLSRYLRSPGYTGFVSFVSSCFCNAGSFVVLELTQMRDLR